MLETANSNLNKHVGIPKPDAIFLGTPTLIHAGYSPLSKPQSESLKKAFAANRIEPGLLHYMTICLPIEQIFTHGDGGIIGKANSTLNKTGGPEIIPLNDTGSFPTLSHPPKTLYLASIEKNYDAEMLNLLLTACRKSSPDFKSFIFNNEPFPDVLTRHSVKRLQMSYEEYLDSEEFFPAYREHLERLFKPSQPWTLTTDFRGRKDDIAALEKMIQAYPHIHIDGGIGVGKTTLLAHLAEQQLKKHKKPVIWVSLQSPNISKTGILLDIGLQLGLIKSPYALEEENLEKFLPLLEKEIERILDAKEILVIVDSLDHLFKDGKNGFENKDIQDLLTRWISGRLSGLFGHQSTKKSCVITTGDLRPQQKGKDLYKNFKAALSHSLNARDQRLFLRPLQESDRRDLFYRWLAQLSDKPRFEQIIARLLPIGGNNLNLLRLLSIWTFLVNDFSKIESHIDSIEKANPWEKTGSITKLILNAIGPDQRDILDTLDFIGKPLHRLVLCSSQGMADILDDMEKKGLLVHYKTNDTITPIFPLNPSSWLNPAENEIKNQYLIAAHQIRSLKRIGRLNGDNTLHSANAYLAANSICMKTELWDESSKTPIINPISLLPKAQFLLKEAKKHIKHPKFKQKMALLAAKFGEKSLQAGIDTGESSFITAQALNLAFPDSHETEIQLHYEKSIRINPRPDKYGNYAQFLYKRLNNFEKAEEQFILARKIESANRFLNIKGLNAQAEFYLQWPGQEIKSADILNRLIGKKDNTQSHLSLAARLFQFLGLKFTPAFFYDAYLELNPTDLRTINAFANACIDWELYPKAAALFENALSINPNDPHTLSGTKKLRKKWGEPSTSHPSTFSFTPDEKTWLISHNLPHISVKGSTQWAAFGILATFYFLKNQLNFPIESFLPHLKTIDDFYEILKNASFFSPLSSPSKTISSPISWNDEWFEMNKKGMELIAYFDQQMLDNPQNPVCAAFLCQAFEMNSWGNIGNEFKRIALQWVSSSKKEWENMINRRSTNLFSQDGKKKFLSFLQTQVSSNSSPKPEPTPITEESIQHYLNHLRIPWEIMAPHMPWQQFNTTEQSSALALLVELFKDATAILLKIPGQPTAASDELKHFFSQNPITVSFMDRLSHFSPR